VGIRRGTPIYLARDAAEFTWSSCRGCARSNGFDSGYHIRWAEPVQRQPSALGLECGSDPRRAVALRGAPAHGAEPFTPPLNSCRLHGIRRLSAGEKPGQFDGFIAGVFSVGPFSITHCVRASRDYLISIDFDPGVYSNGGGSRQPRLLSTTRVMVQNQVWTARIIATR
jgi:hypothetical protein